MQRIASKKNESRFANKKAKWKIGTFLKNIDQYGQEIPSFNLKGEARVNTLFGGIITILILSLTFIYAVLKGIALIERTNPTINDFPIPSYFEISETVNFN